MKITATRAEDLPFNANGAAACAAARAAEVLMELPGVPGQFRVQFIGTGIATMPLETQNVFDVNNAQTSVDMRWYSNKFVGRHWLLGEFKVDLVGDIESTGTIKIAGESKFGSNTINTNDFFFDFQFKRFPSLNMRNVTPIRNSGVISAVPPIGSVFKLEQPTDGVFEFKIGPNRIANTEDAPSKTIKFNQCDVVVFPEQNVGLRLIEQSKVSDDTYSVTIEIENITDVDATFAYFSVIHYAGIQVDHDYGFALLSSGAKKQVSYKVTSNIAERTIGLPFFAALYKPEMLNGSKSLELMFAF